MAHAGQDCRDTTVDLRWDGGQARFNVEVVETPEDRGRGLMFRESLGRYSGMLFVFDAPGPVAFWMKNTLIPLDMIFVDARGVVKKVHSNAVPGSLESIPGGDDILVVLEINGGLSRKIGLAAGAQMRHPTFDKDEAAWPCK